MRVKAAPSRRRHAKWLFLIPFAALLIPSFYSRAQPALFGFPFFYWYQFAWIGGGVLVTLLVAALER